jgi:hypothetical protein
MPKGRSNLAQKSYPKNLERHNDLPLFLQLCKKSGRQGATAGGRRGEFQRKYGPKFAEVGNVTSKRNGVRRYHFGRALRVITIKSNNVSL